MNAKEWTAYLLSPAGKLALKAAARVLSNPNPETDDAALLLKVEAIGFPKWAAVRIFNKCTNRYAPLTCLACDQQFTPRSVFTIDRPYCHPCLTRHYTPEQRAKNEARKLALSARYSGKIKERPCQECGATHGVQMHHPDYSRPLFVVHLCGLCHAAEHKKLRAAV